MREKIVSIDQIVFIGISLGVRSNGGVGNLSLMNLCTSSLNLVILVEFRISAFISLNHLVQTLVKKLCLGAFFDLTILRSCFSNDLVPMLSLN